ncbi:propionate CoA-transferase [Desulfobotulus alkaliphilus]|uniref:Propionate CoA-transferase n=1 Tax=Desulfobotulus alkaliphilus TaxID=622671 RepID=A0A562RQ81_9BACT|nr:hypothetical protein [Desulfobotulus alkaliphilus]TWI70664.1 propionate CoA-transferase [Desulfobotulus alkaliphilus]
MTLPDQKDSLEKRFRYDADKNRFYVNFENYSIESLRDIQRIEFLVAEQLSHLKDRVNAIVNYENFTIRQELMDAYASMVNRLMEHFYAGVTRYTSDEFLREELASSLKRKQVSPNFYASIEDAEHALTVYQWSWG